MHRLLQRQLKKFFGNETEFPEAVQSFVAAVNESYHSFDADREILHRSMELSSEELTQSNSELRAVFEAIPDSILRLDQDGNIVPLKAIAEHSPGPADGHSGKHRISNKVLDIPNRKIRDQFQQALQALQINRETKTIEYSIVTEFEENHFEVRLVPLLEREAIAIIQNVTRRKQAQAEHERLQQELIKASRQAGMAEVATSVLHNVGNVLNSVNVSTTLLRESVGKSQIKNLIKATDLLKDHAADAAKFIGDDPKGQRLPGYLIKLGDYLAAEQSAWQQELEELGQNIEHIKEIVALQQNYARNSGLKEILNPETLVEDSLRMVQAGVQNLTIKVTRDFQVETKVLGDRHKILQILVNLLKNAKQALAVVPVGERSIMLTLCASRAGFVTISITDNGQGIHPDNMARIFQHGFTTKKDGHGFGLHSSANAVREMGGHLSAFSAGLGAGASFHLDLPIATESGSAPAATAILPETIVSPVI